MKGHPKRKRADKCPKGIIWSFQRQITPGESFVVYVEVSDCKTLINSPAKEPEEVTFSMTKLSLKRASWEVNLLCLLVLDVRLLTLLLPGRRTL